jgi:hypothetical protein
MKKNAAYWTHDDEADEHGAGHLYYFGLADRTPAPYLTQRRVGAIIDIASDGTLAGVELIDNMPPPPAPKCGQSLIEQLLSFDPASTNDPSAVSSAGLRLTEIAALRISCLERELADMKARKDAAYLERNECVALLARMALKLGWAAGLTRTAIDGWSDDWHGCVYIDLPAGQVSWHYHDSHANLFVDLPPYVRAWDGHDTPLKYARVRAPLASMSTSVSIPDDIEDRSTHVD